VDTFVDQFLDHLLALLKFLLAAHCVALAYVNLTPTPKDNETYAKVYKLIEALAGLITKLAKQ
jgi:hypothetical protein